MWNYRRRTRWFAAVMLTATVVAATLVMSSIGAPPEPESIRLREARATGITFSLENSPTPEKRLPETMAGGLAAFDYDGDGLTDIFFANGASLPKLAKDGAKHWNRLYRNIGGLHFRDVTAEAGVAGEGYSIGVAVGDFDNDGNPDLFVAGVRRNILYRNRGDGTFEDVTAKAGLRSAEWSVGAAWVDFDNDGRLDLFVVNYVQWSPESDPYCGDASRNLRVYCHPRVFQPTANNLYRNLGNGLFEDVSVQSGIAAHRGKGMAVAVADYDGDGYPDLFVTNDKLPNFLFRNLGNGRFEEVAFDAAVALPDTGAEISAMGTDFRDLDNDGLPDIAYTALSGETFPVFRNVGKGVFADMSFGSRMGQLSRNYSGWGIGIIDFDNDGWKDMFTANSHVSDQVEAFETTTYKQHNSVFRNIGQGHLEDASSAAGPEFVQAVRAHRGCAFADFNQDGRVDVVTSSLGDRPELWENISPAANSWLVLKLRGTVSNRDGIGAVVRIGNQTNHMTSAVGYGSSSHFGVHFGLGKIKQAAQVEIRWPSGIRQTLRNVAANRVLEITEPSDQGRAPREARKR